MTGSSTRRASPLPSSLGTDDAQAEEFWCDVVVPAGGTFDDSGVQVTLAIQGNADFVQEDWTC